MQNPIAEIRERKENLKSINREYLEEKKRIKGRSQLKEKVIRERLKDLSNETAEEISDEREALDQFWEETLEKTRIANKEPNPDAATKAVYAQNLATERLPSANDAAELVSVVQEELEDEANTDTFKKELWNLARRRLQGAGKWDIQKSKMEDLRKEHLLNDNDLQKLRIREGLEEAEARKNTLKEMGRSIYKKIESGQIENKDQLEDQFQQYIEPLMEDFQAAFQNV